MKCCWGLGGGGRGRRAVVLLGGIAEGRGGAGYPCGLQGVQMRAWSCLWVEAMLTLGFKIAFLELIGRNIGMLEPFRIALRWSRQWNLIESPARTTSLKPRKRLTLKRCLINGRLTSGAVAARLLLCHTVALHEDAAQGQSGDMRGPAGLPRQYGGRSSSECAMGRHKMFVWCSHNASGST